jgi:anti-sigma factor ChrR (cupin superfamily)
MEKKNIIKDFIGGWFVGSFEKSLIPGADFEVCVKYYKEGDHEASHMHKIANEYTVIVKGRVMMNGVVYEEHDVIVTEKNTSTDFTVLSNEAITCVVKYPGALNDKYVDE